MAQDFCSWHSYCHIIPTNTGSRRIKRKGIGVATQGTGKGSLSPHYQRTFIMNRQLTKTREGPILMMRDLTEDTGRAYSRRSRRKESIPIIEGHLTLYTHRMFMLLINYKLFMNGLKKSIHNQILLCHMNETNILQSCRLMTRTLMKPPNIHTGIGHPD